MLKHLNGLLNSLVFHFNSFKLGLRLLWSNSSKIKELLNDKLTQGGVNFVASCS